MMEALLIAALALSPPLSAAIITFAIRRNNKKSNPGVEVLLARMDEKLNRLESIEDKLDKLLRR